jgi:anti-sigma regulatory factor (Ser/Thr protein kinase)
VADLVHAPEMRVIRDPFTFAAEYPDFADGMERLGVHTTVLLPLAKGADIVGVLFLGIDDARPITTADEEVLSSVGPIVAQALDRARLYELQRAVASTLQHAMLAGPPITPPELSVAARYLPAIAELEVGGDWYDVVALDENRVAVAVGDIVGRGVQAAAVMGQLRSALRAVATTTSSTTEAVSRLDRFARSVEGAKATTLCYAIVDPQAGTLTYTPAGHPPPLVLERSGAVHYAEAVHGWPLGVADPSRARPEAVETLTPGSTVLFFTDGLVERRGETLDAGFDRLARAATKHVDLPVDQLCDALLDELVGAERPDDIALVALRLVHAGAPAFTCRVRAEPDELRHVRTTLRHWMEHQSMPSEMQADVVLAVGEACTNAIEHAYADRGRATVLVEALRRADDVVITVRDDGAWRPLARDPRRNRGLRLIADVMDELQVSTAATGGTRVEMRRHVDHAMA